MSYELRVMKIFLAKMQKEKHRDLKTDKLGNTKIKNNDYNNSWPHTL